MRAKQWNILKLQVRTIDDALTNACLKLETTSDNIEYEVIEKGSNGLFGIFNSKPTKIKARVKAGVSSVDDEFSKLEAKEKKSIDDTIKSEIKAESKKEVVKETEKAVKEETAPKAENLKVSATQAVNASEEDLEEKANNNEPRPVLSNEETNYKNNEHFLVICSVQWIFLLK